MVVTNTWFEQEKRRRCYWKCVCIYSFYCINQPVDKPQLSYMVNKVHKNFNVKVLKKTLNKAMREFEG